MKSRLLAGLLAVALGITPVFDAALAQSVSFGSGTPTAPLYTLPADGTSVPFTWTTGNAAAFLTLSVKGLSSILIHVDSNTSNGTAVSFFYSNDGTTYDSMMCTRVSDINSLTGAFSYTGGFMCPRVGNYLQLRASGGTAITGSASAVSSDSYKQGLININGSVAMRLSAGNGSDVSAGHILNTSGTSPVNIKASSGRFGRIACWNSDTTWRYLHVYNKSSTPVPGTDTDALTFGIPPGGTNNVSGDDIGFPLGTGLGLAITGGAPANDSTSVTTASVVGCSYTFQ